MTTEINFKDVVEGGTYLIEYNGYPVDYWVSECTIIQIIDSAMKIEVHGKKYWVLNNRYIDYKVIKDFTGTQHDTYNDESLEEVRELRFSNNIYRIIILLLAITICILLLHL